MTSFTIEMTFSEISKKIASKGDVAIRSAIEQLKLLLKDGNKKEAQPAKAKDARPAKAKEAQPPVDPVMSSKPKSKPKSNTRRVPRDVNAFTKRWYDPIVPGYCLAITDNPSKKQYGQCGVKKINGSNFCKRHTNKPSLFGIMGEPIPDTKKAKAAFKKYSKLYPKPEEPKDETSSSKSANKTKTKSKTNEAKVKVEAPIKNVIISPEKEDENEEEESRDNGDILDDLSSCDSNSVDGDSDDEDEEDNEQVCNVLDNDDDAKDAETSFIMGNIDDPKYDELMNKEKLEEHEKQDALNNIQKKLNIVVNDNEDNESPMVQRVDSCVQDSYQPNV